MCLARPGACDGKAPAAAAADELAGAAADEALAACSSWAAVSTAALIGALHEAHVVVIFFTPGGTCVGRGAAQPARVRGPHAACGGAMGRTSALSFLEWSRSFSVTHLSKSGVLKPPFSSRTAALRASDIFLRNAVFSLSKKVHL